MRRRIICSILSALVITASCSLSGGDASQRIVRVKVLADVSFRERNSNWAQEARGLIEAASDYYEREFDIRLVTEKVAAWPESERIASTPELLARMKREFAGQAQSYDLLVTFTAESVSRIFAAGRPRVDRIGNCAEGLSRFMVVPINQIFRYAGPQAEPELDVIALVHEIGHVFGAVHVQDRNSIMHEEFGYRTEFDAKNRALIQTNRSCPFAK